MATRAAHIPISRVTPPSSEAGRGSAATATSRSRPAPRWPPTQRRFGEALQLIAEFDPDAPLVLSLGFDTFERDPISDLALRTADYQRSGAMIGEPGRPIIALQEGGYAIDAIGANAVSFLTGLRG